MQHLLMRALHGATADAVAQPQIFIVAHAPGMLAVVVDEALQLFAQLRRLRPHALESCDDLLHFAGAQVLSNLMDPTVGLLRLFPVKQPGQVPGMFQGVPKVQDFAAAHKHRGPLPDPLGSDVCAPLRNPGLLARPGTCQKSRISQRRTNIVARFQIHSAPSPTITTTVWGPTQPNSRSWAYRRAKMASASPRQLTRKRAPPNGVRARFPPARWATAARRF